MVFSVAAPTLVMDGGARPDWQRNAVLALENVLPNARHRTSEGQDHVPDMAPASALEEFSIG